MNATAATRQICTFTLDGHLFGIDVLHVQEVIRHQEITAVPLAAAALRGLINLRGQIVTAVELRQLLKRPARPEGMVPLNVVVCTDDGTVSLLVDEIGDVIEVDPGTMEAAPMTVIEAARAMIEGVFPLKGALLLLIDPDKVARTLDPGNAAA